MTLTDGCVGVTPAHGAPLELDACALAAEQSLLVPLTRAQWQDCAMPC